MHIIPLYRMAPPAITMHLMILHSIVRYYVVGFGARAVSRKTLIYFIFLICFLIIFIAVIMVDGKEKTHAGVQKIQVRLILGKF